MDFGRKDYNENIHEIIDQAPSDEPVFLLRGSDKLAPTLIASYVKELVMAGVDQDIIDSAVSQCRKMIEWQERNGSRVTDLGGVLGGSRKDSSLRELKEVIEDLKSGNEVNPVRLVDLCTAVYGSGSIIIYTRTDLENLMQSLGCNTLSELYEDLNDQARLDGRIKLVLTNVATYSSSSQGQSTLHIIYCSI